MSGALRMSEAQYAELQRRHAERTGRVVKSAARPALAERAIAHALALRYPAPRTNIKESAFEGLVRNVAKDCGWWGYHTRDSRKCEAGYPDWHLLRPPRSIFVELKTETGKLRPAQERVIGMLRDCGNTVYVWRPSDWKDILSTLQQV